MNIKEILEYVEKDGNHFFGTVIILLILFGGTASIFRAIFQKGCE